MSCFLGAEQQVIAFDVATALMIAPAAPTATVFPSDVNKKSMVTTLRCRASL